MKKNLFKMAAVLLIGIIIGAMGSKIISERINTGWKPIITSGKQFGVSYTTEALFTDLPMPDIKSLSGKAKFIDDERRGEAIELGYLITAEMADLDIAKVPARYKKAVKENINGIETTAGPLENAYYAVEFEFQLKDKDGFILQTVKSDKETLVSGRINTFQNKLKDKIPYDIAARTEQIEIHPSIVQCESCKSNPGASDKGINDWVDVPTSKSK